MPRFIEYEEDEVFPFPRDRVWSLLAAHNDDSKIAQIHPLIQRQRTVSQAGSDTVLDRTIDARGTALNSQWKITLRPPDYSRYEILSGEGPWSAGSAVENHYSDAPAGTRIQSRLKMHIKVLPFFLPQRAMSRRILNTIDHEDQAYLKKTP